MLLTVARYRADRTIEGTDLGLAEAEGSYQTMAAFFRFARKAESRQARHDISSQP